MYTESTVEDAALAWFGELGYAVLHGPDIDPESSAPERGGFGDVVLRGRLRDALASLNPDVPAASLDDAVRRLTVAESPSLIESDRAFHRYVTDGVPVEYQAEGRTIHGSARLFDVDDPNRNDWLAVNQFTVIEGQAHRRPDVVVFVNGLPLAVIELKNIAAENATVKHAFSQLQTYKAEIPSLFAYNEALVVSDGIQARIGSLTANWEWFMPWRTVDGLTVAPPGQAALETLIKGVFAPARFLDYIRHFIVFEDDGGAIVKKLAGYHQFHAVNKAVDCAVRAASAGGDQKAGVIWHTQGSGKSLSMAFFVGKIKQHPALANPTVVVLTDRNDLDGQLFSNFALAQQVLREPPVQAESREEMRKLLSGRAAGGIVFTTVQKFLTDDRGAHPLLSDRRNIICIADEAHRSQYDFVDGVARRMREALPHATFIGFTGTPIELTGAVTTAVFGDYIDVYDIQQAVQDGATVRIFYESRMARIKLDDAARPHIDEDVEEFTEGDEVEHVEKLKTKWAQVEALVGTPQRLSQVAADIVQHFEARQAIMQGKAMIVCMSRRICVDLYNQIVALRPAWGGSSDDQQGLLKVVMTGGPSDPVEWQQHIRNKARRDELAKRFRRNPDDPFKLAIVRDMWLTGFDVPCLHTMYLDKPMRGHGLMQAIARVNRVYKDKPGGLIVDYLGVAHELKRALTHYTKGDRQVTGIDVAEAAAVVQEKLEIIAHLFHGFVLSGIGQGPATQQISLVSAAMNHLAGLDDGTQRFLKLLTELKQALALVGDHELVRANWDRLAFYQAVGASLHKHTVTQGNGRLPQDMDTAMQQIISRAVVAEGIVDIFAAAGLKSPDVSILSDQFLADVQGMQQRNLAVEVLHKLLHDQISTRKRKHLVQARSFADMLEAAIRRYHNKSVEAAKVIEELIALAKDMRAADKRGEELGLTDDELAFYEALEVNDSAVQVLGDDTLRAIAQELLDTVRRDATIDWTMKENVRAKLRRNVRRILRKHGYPPDKQEKATQTVLEQAELMAAEGLAA